LLKRNIKAHKRIKKFQLNFYKHTIKKKFDYYYFF